jgi:type II secretory ATPase GspE/PulE/Tfp pilus assembly ATPase PilB-like protein
VQAGMTGHLVISTIHSGTTAGVFARLINMDIEPFLLASSIIGVMGVRLIRKNCQYCTQPYEPEAGLVRMMTTEQAENASFRRGGGCTQCAGTGFIGRTSITELMLTSDPIRDALMMKKPSRVLQQLATDAGMETLWDTGVRRVMDGSTPLEEIVRVVAADQV